MRAEKAARMKIFVAELKKNSYLNSEEMVNLFEELNWDSKVSLNCSKRTFSRDKDELVEKFGAPIQFCHERNGYYLEDMSWTLDFPDIDEENLEATFITSKLAQDIAPSSLAGEFRKAVSTRLSRSADIFNQQSLSNFFSADTLVVDIDREVMKTIYNAWKESQGVTIRYCRPDGSECKRLIEPHVVTCADRIWYVKGYCHERRENRIFALHRIVSAKLEQHFFTPDLELGQKKHRQDFFEYTKVRGASLWCAAELAPYIREQAEARNISIEEQSDNSLIISLPELNEDDLVRWILGEGALIKVLEPQSLKQKVVAKLHAALELYSASGQKF